MSWFKKLFGKDTEQEKKAVVQKANIAYAQFNYPPKIILAWIKALEGNQDLAMFLLNNGYEELYHITQAIFLKQEARNWLMNNGYPHLMAFVNASEGNESAAHWLQVHGFEVLYHMSQAIEGEMKSFVWLKGQTNFLLFELAKQIKTIKDNIEFNHNDMYSFGKDA